MLSQNNSKLKNINIKEFNSIHDFETFKNNNPNYIVHDIKIIQCQYAIKIFLIFQIINS